MASPYPDPRIERIPRPRGVKLRQCSALVAREGWEDVGVTMSRKRYIRAINSQLDPSLCMRWAEYSIDEKPYCFKHASVVCLGIMLEPEEPEHCTFLKALNPRRKP